MSPHQASASRPYGFCTNLFLALLSLFALGLGGCAQETETNPESPPPVILIDIDTLRADHLGCYGYSRDTSPHLDAWSNEAVRFAWTFSQAPNTPPSQASILTSLYPTSHGRIADEEILADSVDTLAELFQRAGYATGAFVDGGLMAAEFGLDQGFDIYDDAAGGLAAIDPKARAWLAEHKEQPFFLLVHTYDVHSPYENTPEPYRSRYLEGLELPEQEFRDKLTWLMEQRRMSQYSENPQRLTPVQVEYARALYDGGIRAMDDWLGDFFDFLKKEGVYDRALIAFVSDHGDAFEEHNTVFHERLYTPVTRVPMLVRFPEGRHGGGVIEEAVETLDLMPTLLAGAGLSLPEALHGQDLLPLIRGEEGHRELAVSESPFFGRRVALTTSEFRLIHTARGGASELYAYREDPLEQRDLAAERPEVVEQLQAGVESWEALVEAHQHGGEVAKMKDSTIEQLRALGYLQ
jgi:arylsulfatase A-like enzyme